MMIIIKKYITRKKWAMISAEEVFVRRMIEDAYSDTPFIYNIFGYIKNFIEGTIFDSESVITKGPRSAFWYSREVIKGRWKKAESVIIRDPEYACYYARDMIKGRWVDLETKLFEEGYEDIAKYYCEIFYTEENKSLPLWLKYHKCENEISDYSI